MRRFPRWLILPLIFLIALSGFLIWGLTPLGPAADALASLEPDSAVMTRGGSIFEFIPRQAQPTTGLILYPGGRVDWRSYAPLARSIAAHGYYVAIVPMPLSLAVLSPGSAAEVIASQPGIRHWAVGGHSLGGAMAAYFAYQQPDLAEGLVLWAAYPAKSSDLSGSGLKVVSIYASEDGLTTQEEIDASRSLLPADTHWVEIVGGNHAQFGKYGRQPGDGVALISLDEQQRQVAEATLDLLGEVAVR